MQKRIVDAYKENDEEALEYLHSVKSHVENGGFFKDSLSWYFFKYLTPICDRTLLVFGACISMVVLFLLYEMVKISFPLVEEKPIFVSAKDPSLYFPNLIHLKPKEGELGYDRNVETVDEAVLKYLVGFYVENRESFDFSEAKVEDVNKKFEYLRQLSTAEEFKRFQAVMSKDNPESPINFFGKNVIKYIKIESIKMIKEESDNVAIRAKDFIISKIPTSAEVRFVLTTRVFASKIDYKEKSQRYLAKMRFRFGGISVNSKDKKLDFSVNSYRLFRIN